MLKFFDVDPVSGMAKIRILDKHPDPQHWLADGLPKTTSIGEEGHQGEVSK
jgi:hypothetical protein